MTNKNTDNWRALTEQNSGLKDAAETILAIRLPKEDAAACLPSHATDEHIEKLRGLAGFSDHVQKMLDSIQHNAILTDELEHVQINTNLSHAVKHIVMVKDGLQRLAHADKLPPMEERALRADISHGNEHGLYQKIADHLNTIAKWIEFRTKDIEQMDATAFEDEQKREHVRNPHTTSRLMPQEIHRYNETLYTYHHIHPEQIRATAKALSTFQQEYDRILGSAIGATTSIT